MTWNPIQKSVCLWLAGAVYAVFLLWGVTSVCVDSRAEQVYDAELGRVIFAPGSVRQYRKEGWATTRYGKYGFPGITDVTRLAGPKVMIWGDSHVEAQEVADADKMATVASALWRDRHPERPTAFMSWGESGANLANHCFDIPRYEKVFPNLSRHYIVMSFTRRAFPNDQRATSAFYVEKQGEYSIVEKPTPPPSAKTVALRQALCRWRLNVFFAVYSKLSLSSLSSLRFRLGPVSAPPASPDMPAFDEAYAKAGFAWILGELKHRTTRPVTIVYIPESPRIVSGSIVEDLSSLDPDEAARLAVLRDACRASGVGLIDLSEAFCRAARGAAQFPRGFSNTRPSEGHLNALGHRLVAEAIVADVEASRP
jgi:hypothetical protein